MEEQERQKGIDQAEPRLLYHYTDQKGLLGIIENKCLWATHSQFLNDLSEYQIAFDALQKKIRTERNDNWANLLSSFLLARQIKGIFVSSFSHERKADSLTMWRGYSAPLGGYSIGFDRLVLNLIANEIRTSEEKRWAELGKCFYTDPENSSLAESLEKQVESDWNDPTGTGTLRPNIMEYVKLAALAKHIAFEEEDEWRIVVFDERGSEIRTDEISPRQVHDSSLFGGFVER
jgi:hypothetical protein